MIRAEMQQERFELIRKMEYRIRYCSIVGFKGFENQKEACDIEGSQESTSQGLRPHLSRKSRPMSRNLQLSEAKNTRRDS